MPDPVKDLKHESGPYTFAGFGFTNNYFSNYEDLTGLKVPFVEILKKEDVIDLILSEKVSSQLITINLNYSCSKIISTAKVRAGKD